MDAAAIPTVLVERLGPEATIGLIQTLDLAQRECVEMTVTQSIDRFERRLTEETSKLRVEIGGVRLEIAGLRQDMEAQKTDTLKWSFLFWIGQVVALGGFMAAMLR
jgi:hypothetical protein